MITGVTIDNATLAVNHIQKSDERPTIIFLHDSLGCIELWRDFPEQLGKATNCNVLVYDRQGYGRSAPFASNARSNDYMEIEADVLHELIVHYALKEVILFGHSDGGSIALIAGGKYPAHIIGIITEGAHIFVEKVTLQGIREAADAYRTMDLKQKLEKYHGSKTDSIFRAWAETWLTDEFRSWNIESFLPQIKCPALAIQGANDEFGTEAQVDGIVNQISGKATILIIPGVGHTPHKEARQVVLERSVDFIGKIIGHIQK